MPVTVLVDIFLVKKGLCMFYAKMFSKMRLAAGLKKNGVCLNPRCKILHMTVVDGMV